MSNEPRKRGLGRGLDSLLGIVSRPPTAAQPTPLSMSAEPIQEHELRMVPLDAIHPNRYQPRKEIAPESLQELADSIRSQGLMQPIVVRTTAAGSYELIAGERRWRASRLAGLDEIPVLVREVEDRGALVLALIENIQREDLNPLEQATALQRLIAEFTLTHQQIAEAVGKSRASVSNLLRLLELAPETKHYLEHGEMEMGHARALLGLAMMTQVQLAHEVVEKGWSVRQTEDKVRQMLVAEKRSEVTPSIATDQDTLRLQQTLSERLGAAVKIVGGQRGKGKLVISYNSLDELDGILAHLH